MSSVRQQARDTIYMDQALALAAQAMQAGEVPVGAVLVLNDEVVGTGFNRIITDCDPSAHAELVALRSAASLLKRHRLDGSTLYVTLEPCLMCCGALLQARIARLVYGAREPRTGGVVSVHDSLRLPGISHHVAIDEGIRAQACARLLQDFFRELRKTALEQPQTP